MTVDDARVEAAAKAMWQDESLRARGAPRNIPWSEVHQDEQDRWRRSGKAALAAADAVRDQQGASLTGRANLKQTVSTILGGALSGADRYTHRPPEGGQYTRWGAVEREIHAAIDAKRDDARLKIACAEAMIQNMAERLDAVSCERDELRALLIRARAHGGIEPQLDTEIDAAIADSACDCREPCSDDRCPGWIAQGERT